MSDVKTWFSLIEQHNYNEVRSVQRKYAGARNEDGCTGLMIAVKNNDLTMVEILSEIESGFVNNKDETALFLACARNYEDICTVLIPKEKSLRQSSTGYTPLIVAAANGSSRVIPLLTPHFGNETDRQGYTALDYATYNNYHLCVDLLIKSEKFSVPDLERAVRIANECGHTQLHSKLTAQIMHRVKTLGDRATMAATQSKLPFNISDFKQLTTNTNRFSGVAPSPHTDKLGSIHEERHDTGHRKASPGSAGKKVSPGTPNRKGTFTFGRATSRLKDANQMAMNEPQIGSVIPPLSDLGEIFRRNREMRNKSVRSAQAMPSEVTRGPDVDLPQVDYSNEEMSIIQRMNKMKLYDRDEDDGVISMSHNPDTLNRVKHRAQSNRVVPRPTYLLSPEHDSSERQATREMKPEVAAHDQRQRYPDTSSVPYDAHSVGIDVIMEEKETDNVLIPPEVLESYQDMESTNKSGVGTSQVGRSTSIIGLPLNPSDNIDTATALKKISKMTSTELRVACVEMLECIEGKERLLTKLLDSTVLEFPLATHPQMESSGSQQNAELAASCDKYRSQAIDLQTKLDSVADAILTRSSQVYDTLFQILKLVAVGGQASQWVKGTPEAHDATFAGVAHLGELCERVWSTQLALLEDVKNVDSVLVREANRIVRKDSLTGGIQLPTAADVVALTAKSRTSSSEDASVQALIEMLDTVMQTDTIVAPRSESSSVQRLPSAAESPAQATVASPVTSGTTTASQAKRTPHHTPSSYHEPHSEKKDDSRRSAESKESPLTTGSVKHTSLMDTNKNTPSSAAPTTSSLKDAPKPTGIKVDESGNSNTMRSLKKILKLDPYKVGDDGKSVSSRAHPLDDEEKAKLAKLFEDVKRDIKKQAGHANNNGLTTLMMAAAGNNIELIKILIPYEAGICVVTANDPVGNTATRLALQNGNMEATDLLLKAEGFEVASPDKTNGRKTELMTAAEQGDIVNVYLYAPFQAGLIDPEGKTALMYAAGNGHAKILQYLKTEAKMTTSSGTTAMMMASINGHNDCCKFLLEFERGMTDKNKMTALMHAASLGHKTCVEVLIKEVGAKTKEGMNALMYAAQAGSKPCVEYILRKYPKEKAGVTTEKSKYGAGCTPADIATKAGHADLAPLLA